MGRPIRAEGPVQLESHGRSDPKLQAEIGRETEGRVDGDVGFHLLADSFNGPTNRLNVVPGNGQRLGDLRNLNGGDYAKFENEVRRLAQKPGAKVEIRVEPRYNPGNTTRRPDSFVARYREEGGKWDTKVFRNEPQ